MSTWATVQDVLDRWVGDDVPEDTSLVQAILDDSEVVVLSVYPGIQTRIDAGDLSAASVKVVVVRMTTRVLRNPENLRSWMQVTGPFSQQRSFSDSDIFMTAQEKQMLAPAIAGKAFEIDTAPNITSIELYDEIDPLTGLERAWTRVY